MPLSHKDIAEIVKMVDASELDELVIEFPDITLAVRRGGGGEGPDPAPILHPSPPAATPAPMSRAATASPPSPSARADGAIEVRAPMIGTFHRSPSPGDSPLVEIGDTVKPGQPLGVIEVLRRHTPIEATQAGRIAEIPAVDGALVEYDQVLFVIAPA